MLTLGSSGFGSHGDYMFGWKGDSLQRAMDSPCYVNCPTLETQSIEEMNKCSVPNVVDEVVDGCKCSIENDTKRSVLNRVLTLLSHRARIVARVLGGRARLKSSPLEGKEGGSWNPDGS